MNQYSQWQGKVQGNEIYRVVIQAELVTDVSRFNSCNCPFDGPICKHQIAVLYTIQMKDHEKPKKDKTSADKVTALLSKLTFEELKGLCKGSYRRR